MRSLFSVMSSPLLIGGALSVGFYQLLPYIPWQRELLQRYFCGHPLEYVIAGLFFVGMSVLGKRALGLWFERSVLRIDPLEDDKLTELPDALAKADAVDVKLSYLAAPHRETHLVRRIDDACRFVQDRQSDDGMEEHLKYLAELAAERAHASLALVRTITWAVPIIGFLGTVIGITMAIAELTPEQLESSLNTVTSGLAVAFDTTALSLALTLVLVFATFRIERSEGKILSIVEDYGLSRLGILFPGSRSTAEPMAEATAIAAKRLMERTDTLLTEQMTLWKETLESMRERWITSMDRQREEFDKTLESTLEATLEELKLQTQVLDKLTEQDLRLSRIQTRLTENLEAVRNAGTFDETLHSLNAAVHLLTARTGKAA